MLITSILLVLTQATADRLTPGCILGSIVEYHDGPPHFERKHRHSRGPFKLLVLHKSEDIKAHG